MSDDDDTFTKIRSRSSSRECYDGDGGSDNAESDETTVLLGAQTVVGAQTGVQKIEATAAVWSRKTLIVAYVM